MANNIIKNKKGNALLWIAIILIVLVVLFFIFKGLSPAKEEVGKEVGDLNSLDVGENPDLQVDDFDSFQVSSGEITG